MKVTSGFEQVKQVLETRQDGKRKKVLFRLMIMKSEVVEIAELRGGWQASRMKRQALDSGVTGSESIT